LKKVRREKSAASQMSSIVNDARPSLMVRRRANWAALRRRDDDLDHSMHSVT
jgi:hypothetical protein